MVEASLDGVYYTLTHDIYIQQINEPTLDHAAKFNSFTS